MAVALLSLDCLETKDVKHSSACTKASVLRMDNVLELQRKWVGVGWTRVKREGPGPWCDEFGESCDGPDMLQSSVLSRLNSPHCS